ncbi:hypothetical protein scyTo_0001546 [Scyliorhinus torazame]|uniref:Uncharacterized protein n=1 Tax=Scyliorhinus torazame TaxID=75743 RepID=A0A401PE51_SCYTO|nr:hypothetical protein [Scyliorhinus torazame]
MNLPLSLATGICLHCGTSPKPPTPQSNVWKSDSYNHNSGRGGESKTLKDGAQNSKQPQGIPRQEHKANKLRKHNDDVISLNIATTVCSMCQMFFMEAFSDISTGSTNTVKLNSIRVITLEWKSTLFTCIADVTNQQSLTWIHKEGLCGC